MRSIKLIFAVIIIGALAIFFAMPRERKPMTRVLKVAFPYDKPARFYEPTKIHLAPEYIFLENTFSPLVELSPNDGTVQKGVAEKWEWKGNELHLTIRKGLKTIDGTEITAKDAEFSIKRVLVKTGNTHGNFQDLVCGARTIKKIEDICEGIRVEGDTLVLKTSSRSPFILPMLTGIDFAIIPKSSVDPKTLDIKDYRNTTGPYYVSQDSESGKIILTLNPGHYHASKAVPEKIELIPTDPKNKEASLALFKSGNVDMITTIDSARPEQIFRLSREVSGTSFHSTANIRTISVFFTERGMKELSHDERLLLGQQITGSLQKNFLSLPGYERTHQFFPAHGDGAIDLAQAQAIAESHPAITKLTKKVELSILRVGDIATFKKLIEEAAPTVQVVEGKNAPAFEKFKNISDMPHAFIGGPDTGFNEDISLISYSLNAGLLLLTPEGRVKWLAEYMALADKDERIQKLRKLHQDSLENITLYPMFSCPYTALAQNGWNIQLSKILANNPLWLVKAM